MTSEHAPSYRNAALFDALKLTSSRPDHFYASPEYQPKRASVALIIWIKPAKTYEREPDPKGTHYLKSLIV
jgi:hypothetical protein